MPCVRSVGVSIPDFLATNDYVRRLAVTESANIWNAKKSDLSNLVQDFFGKIGSLTRTWRSMDSLPKQHIEEAVRNCLASVSNWNPDHLSSVIYCGIDRGFVEPAHASVLAAQLGLNNVRAFDVSDACLGWYTACEAARAFATNDKPLSLIISGEFPIDKPGLVFPDSFRIEDETSFKWKAAALTLGEMATATLVDASVTAGEMEVRSENQHNQLCLVPIKKPHRFINWENESWIIQESCFVANCEKLAIAGFRPGLSVLQQLLNRTGDPDFILPHSFSEYVPRTVAQHLGVADKLHNVFQDVGNISTSSIPFALWALSQKTNIVGKNIVGWIASAGMKHAAFQIRYHGI